MSVPPVLASTLVLTCDFIDSIKVLVWPIVCEGKQS